MSYIRGRYANEACDNAKKRDNTLIVRGIRSGDREKKVLTYLKHHG